VTAADYTSRSRREQGLTEKITDPATLATIVALMGDKSRRVPS
jgi:hypothetical protein